MAVAAHLVALIDAEIPALQKIKQVNTELAKLAKQKTDFSIDLDIQFKQGTGQKLSRSLKTITSTLSQNAFVDIDLRLKQGTAIGLRQQIKSSLQNSGTSLNIGGSGTPATPRATSVRAIPNNISREQMHYGQKIASEIDRATASVAKLRSSWSPAISQVKQYETTVKQAGERQRAAAKEAANITRAVDGAHAAANRMNAAFDRSKVSLQKQQGAAWAREIDNGYRRAGQSLNRFGEMTPTVTGHLKTLNATASESAGTFGRVRSTLLGLGVGYAVFNGIRRALEGVKGAAIDFNAKQEQALVGLRTQMGGNSTAAKSLYLDLQRLNDLSPFREEDILPNAQKFLAAKMSVNDLKDALRGISEQTSALGGNSQKFNQIATALNQIWIKPRLGLEELTQQLVEHGVPAFDLLAKAYKTNSGQIQEWITKGMIPGKEAARALWNQMERQNFGAAEKQSKTFTGALSTLSDILNRRLGAAFKGTFDRITRLLNGANRLAQNKSFITWSTGVGAAMAQAAGWIVRVTTGVVGFTKSVYGNLGPLRPFVVRAAVGIGLALLGINPVLASLVAGISGFYVAYRGNILGVKTITDRVVSFVVDGIKTLSWSIAVAVENLAKMLQLIPDAAKWVSPIAAALVAVKNLLGDQSGLADGVMRFWEDADREGARFRENISKPFDLKAWTQSVNSATSGLKPPALYVPKLGDPRASSDGERKGRASRTNKYGLVQPDKDDQANAIYNEQRRRQEKLAKVQEIAPMSLSKLKRLGAAYVEPNVWKVIPTPFTPRTVASVDTTGKMPTAADIMRERGRFIAWRGQRDKHSGVGNLKEYGRIQDAAGKAATASDLFARSIQAKTRALRDGAQWLKTNVFNSLEYGKTQALAAFRTDQWGDSNILAMLKADKLNKTYTASAEVNRRVTLETQRLNTALRVDAFSAHTERVRDLDREYEALGDTTVQQAAARRMANREDRNYLTQAERIAEITREVRNEISKTTQAMIDGAKERARGIRQTMEDAAAKNPLDLLNLKNQREDQDNSRRGIFLDLGQSLRVAVARGQELAETARAWRADGFRATLETVNGLLSSADLTSARVAETINGINKGVADRTIAPNAAVNGQQQADLLGNAFDRTRARAMGQLTGLESWGEQLDALTQQAAQFRTAQSQAWDEFVTRNATPAEQAEATRAKILALIPAFKAAAIGSGQSIGQISEFVARLTSDIDAGVAKARELGEAASAAASSDKISGYLNDVRDRTALSSTAPGIGRELLNIKQQLVREKWTPEEIDAVLPTAQIAMKGEALRDQLSGVMNDLRGTLSSTFDAIRENGLRGIGSLFDGVLDKLNQFASEFLTNRIWSNLEGVFTSLLGGLGGKGAPGGTTGIAGVVGAIGGGLGVKMPSSAVGGGLFRAKGGAVEADKSYVVGERGPELFRATRSGSIIPHETLKGLALSGGGNGGGRLSGNTITLAPVQTINIEQVVTDSPEDFMNQMQRRGGTPQSVQLHDLYKAVQQGGGYD